MDAKLAEYVKLLQEQAESGVLVARLNPMHTGHQMVIEVMLAAFPQSHLLLIGSCANPISIRHLFRFSDRYRFVKTIFPSARIAPIPDFETDEEWLTVMEHMLQLAGLDPSKTVFIGGCDEDVNYYHGRGYKVQIINRFDGTTINVSGTEIRDMLIHNRNLGGVVDRRIIPDLQETFKLRWEEATKR